MKRRLLFFVILSAVVLAIAGAGVSAAAEQVLKAGTYTASVKALPCGGCGPLVKKTLESMKEIESAAVDSKALTVQFVVKKDATVKLEDVQKNLDAAARNMGMGADYTLSNVKPKN